MEDIAHELGIQGDDLWFLAQAYTGLGDLPSGDGSNLAYGLGQQQVRLGGLQHLLVDLVDPQTSFSLSEMTRLISELVGSVPSNTLRTTWGFLGASAG